MPKQDFENLIKGLEEKNKQNKSRYDSLTDQKAVIKALDAVQNAVVQSIGVLINTLLEDTLKTQVTNQIQIPKNIGTPDALAGANTVKNSIDQLKQAVKDKDIDFSGVLTHLEGIHGVLDQLPKEYPSFPEMPSEMAVNNLSTITKKLDALTNEVKKLKLNPKIDVSSPEVKIDLSKEMKSIEKAIKSIPREVKIPEQKDIDLSEVVGAMKDVKKTIESIQFPVPNFRTQDIVDAVNNLEINVDNLNVDAVTTRIATDGSDANVSYIGKAAIGSPTNTAVWQIRQVDETSGTVITFADGDADFNNIWDNRESLSYS